MNQFYSIRTILLLWTTLALGLTSLLMGYFLYQAMNNEFHHSWHSRIYNEMTMLSQQLQYNLSADDWRLADKNVAYMATYPYINKVYLVEDGRIRLSTRREEIHSAAAPFNPAYRLDIPADAETANILFDGKQIITVMQVVNFNPAGQRSMNQAWLLAEYDIRREHQALTFKIFLRLSGLATLMLMFSIGLNQLVRRQVLLPLISLRDFTRHLRKGGLGDNMPIHGSQEFRELAQAFNQLSEHLHLSARQLHHQHAVDQAFARAFPDVAVIIDEHGCIHKNIRHSGNPVWIKDEPYPDGQPLWHWIEDTEQQQRIREGWHKARQTKELIQDEIIHRGRYLDSRMVQIPETRLNREGGSVLWLLRDITELRSKQQEVEYQARFDNLTGLSNRQTALAAIQTSLENHEAARFGVILFIDLDHFKAINDSLGHGVGDSLLVDVAMRIQKLANHGQWLAARLGGDEFLMISRQIFDSREEAINASRNLCVQLLAHLSEPFAVGMHWFHLSASIGVSIYPLHCANAADILREADTAMYYAKARGRNTWRLYDDSMQQESNARLQMLNDLHDALLQQRFSIAFQPQFNAAGEVCGAEVLCRWNRHGVAVSPDQFISAAEELNLIAPLGDWVFRQACLALRQWRDNQLLPASFDRLAINVSPDQFHNPAFAERLKSIIHETGISAADIELEITENVFMEQRPAVLEQLQALTAYGFSIALDDFGTGYSSLGYLQYLPIQKLKIDRTFISTITEQQLRYNIADTIIQLARSLSLKVVAEGVENSLQHEFLLGKQCDLFQGYYFSPPMNIRAFGDYLQTLST